MYTRKLPALGAAFMMLALLLGGCNLGFLADSPQDSPDGTVAFRVALGGSYSSFQQPRTVKPVVPSDTVYKLYGSSAGATDVASQDLLASVNDPALISLNLVSGVWNFTLQMCTFSGSVLLQGSAGPMTLSTTPVTASFDMKPVSTSDGSYSVVLNWPACSSLLSVGQTLDGISPGTIIYSDPAALTTLTFSGSASPGEHWLVISFYGSGTKPLATVTEKLLVLPDLTSTRTINLDAQAFNSAPSAPSALTALFTANAVNAALVDITLNWVDASDTEQGFTVCDGTGAVISDLAAGATSYSVQGLAAGSSYSYQVRSFNAWGNSAFASANVTVPEAATSSTLAISLTGAADYASKNLYYAVFDQSVDLGAGTNVPLALGSAAIASDGTVSLVAQKSGASAILPFGTYYVYLLIDADSSLTSVAGYGDMIASTGDPVLGGTAVAVSLGGGNTLAASLAGFAKTEAGVDLGLTGFSADAGKTVLLAIVSSDSDLENGSAVSCGYGFSRIDANGTARVRLVDYTTGAVWVPDAAKTYTAGVYIDVLDKWTDVTTFAEMITSDAIPYPGMEIAMLETTVTDTTSGTSYQQTTQITGMTTGSAYLIDSSTLMVLNEFVINSNYPAAAGETDTTRTLLWPSTQTSSYLSSSMFSCRGYALSGWATTADATTPEYPADSSFTIDWSAHTEHSVTLYAVWTAATAVSQTINLYTQLTGYTWINCATDLSSGVLRGTEIAVTAPDYQESYRWFVDGVELEGSTTNVLAYSTAGLAAGTHSIYLLCVDSAGTPSSATLSMLITE